MFQTIRTDSDSDTPPSIRGKMERASLCLVGLFGLLFAAVNIDTSQQLPLYILLTSSTSLFIWGMLFKPNK